MLGPPKTAAGRRIVTVPPHILDVLGNHLSEFVGVEPTALVCASPEAPRYAGATSAGGCGTRPVRPPVSQRCPSWQPDVPWMCHRRLARLGRRMQISPLTWDFRGGDERTRTADPLLAKNGVVRPGGVQRRTDGTNITIRHSAILPEWLRRWLLPLPNEGFAHLAVCTLCKGPSISPLVVISGGSSACRSEPDQVLEARPGRHPKRSPGARPGERASQVRERLAGCIFGQGHSLGDEHVGRSCSNDLAGSRHRHHRHQCHCLRAPRGSGYRQGAKARAQERRDLAEHPQVGSDRVAIDPTASATMTAKTVMGTRRRQGSGRAIGLLDEIRYR